MPRPPLRFTLRQLEYLVAVGEAGSIVAAAQRLNVSSPSISAAIAALEAEFGLPLFVRRHAQGLSLTQGGRQVAEQAARMLDAGRTVGETARAATRQVRGPLSVGCLVTFALVVLPTLRRTFVDAHPAVDFRQSERDQAGLIAGLRRAEIDVALTYDLDIPPDLLFMPLAVLPPYALLPQGHPLASRDRIAVADLAPHPMVLLDLPHSTDYFLSLFTAEGLRPRIAERTRDLGVMRALVAHGFGFSIANMRVPGDAAPDGRPLVTQMLSGDPRPMVLGLLTAEGTAAALTPGAFVAHAAAEVARGAVPGLAGAGRAAP
jgi:DNA-binding transcriptional LysR family regulator